MPRMVIFRFGFKILLLKLDADLYLETSSMRQFMRALLRCSEVDQRASLQVRQVVFGISPLSITEAL